MDKKKKGVVVFFAGALVGLAAAEMIGHITTPDRPHFEGSGGYHYLAMLVVYPLASLIFGVAFLVGYKLSKRRESKNGQVRKNIAP